MPIGSRLRRVARIAVTALLAHVATLLAAPAPVASAVPAEQFITAPGPLGPITVIGDSVLLGSLYNRPSLADQLAAHGWGPVRMRAGEGYRTGVFPMTPSYDVSLWIETWRAQGWDPVDVVVNLGANDSGFCTSLDVACARRSIMHVVDTLGPGHRIWWPKITRLFTHGNQQNTWNTALDQIDAERADFFTWDWPTEMFGGGYPSHDMTHLSPDGYRRRSAVMARHITNDLVAARRVGGDQATPPPLGPPSEFVALTPDRVFDSREGGAAALAPQSQVSIDMRSFVPPAATAVAVNITSDAAPGAGFLTGFACGAGVPEASAVNHTPFTPRAGFAIVPLSTDGRLCVYTHAGGHVIVDLQGAFVGDHRDGLRLSPIAPPARLLDTRITGRASELVVAAPSGARAVVINLTATGATAPGWLKAYPCGATVPPVSNVNYLANDTVAGTAFVPVSAQGTFCVQSMNAVDVVVDITATFAVGGALRFVPVQPTRMLDTRIAVGGWSPMHGAHQTIDVGVVPPTAAAVSGTLTIVAPVFGSWLKAFPCGPEPVTSSVNANPDLVLANGITVGVGSGGRLCITALTATHSLFDVTGWWVA